MKFKIVLFLSVFFLLMLFYSCANVGSTPDGEKSDGDLNLYLITTNGSLNSLSQNAIDAEYNTFFFLPGETRKIYLGGKLPTDYRNYNSLWLENPSIWNPRHTEGIYSSYINANNYYGIPIGLSDIPVQSGDYNVYARVGLESGSTYTPYSTKNLTFKVSPNYEDRDWGLRVYQQQSYNVLNLTKDEIVSAFNEMKVYLGIDGGNIVNVNNSLADETLTYDFSDHSIVSDPCVIYAFNKIYPGEQISTALQHYMNEYPNEGMIFFVKDYNAINIPLNPKYPDGFTLSNTGVNGTGKLAPISFIFVQRLRDLASSEWENKVIQNTTIHELGHLWCEGFTDNETHSLWHNGNNLNNCVMKSDLVYNNTVPDNNAQKVLNFRRFCEGHLQRGMNVSWHLKQYSPYGEQTTQQNQIILASNKNFNYLQNKDLEIEISCDKTEYIQGESFNIYVKFLNNSDEPIKITSSPKHYLQDLNRDSLRISNFNSHPLIEIPAHSEYDFLIDPLHAIAYNGNGIVPGYPWFYWYTGDYNYYISQSISNNEYKSNKINIRINPVPDSLLQAFQELKDYVGFSKTGKDWNTILEKNKGHYYEKEFYYRLLTTLGYFDKINETNSQLYEEFIVKYPDNDFSYRILNYLSNYYEKNKGLVDRIIERLRTKSPNSKLLMVLRNQPEYMMNNQIKHLLK